MRSKVILLALVMSACGKDLTEEFIGNWTLTSGRFNTTCGSMQSSADHTAGDITLAITSKDRSTLSIAAGLADQGIRAGTCDLTATAVNETFARLEASACQINMSSYNVIDGTLTLSSNRAMTLNLVAEYPAPVGTCRQTSVSTLASQ